MFSYVTVTKTLSNTSRLQFCLNSFNLPTEDVKKIELLLSALKEHGSVQMNFQEYALYKSLLDMSKKYDH